jgi:hypothetical protein
MSSAIEPAVLDALAQACAQRVHAVWLVGKLSACHTAAAVPAADHHVCTQCQHAKATQTARLERREGRGSATASSLRPGNPV